MIDYVTSDLHLGHENIIDLTDRPFDSVEEMDSTLISNWNSVVSATDTVLFLGDLVAYSTTKRQKEYLDRLNGDIIFIRGNHDEITMNTQDCIPVYESLEFQVEGISFYATHHPEDLPNIRWLLHGHVHNNDLYKYPLYDPQHNRLNLSIELTDYMPISMKTIVSIIKTENTQINTLQER